MNVAYASLVVAAFVASSYQNAAYSQDAKSDIRKALLGDPEDFLIGEWESNDKVRFYFITGGDVQMVTPKQENIPSVTFEGKWKVERKFDITRRMYLNVTFTDADPPPPGSQGRFKPLVNLFYIAFQGVDKMGIQPVKRKGSSYEATKDKMAPFKRIQ